LKRGSALLRTASDPDVPCGGALAHLKALLLPRGTKRWGTAERPPFQWAIEGDIKGCFDHIDHHALMERVRRRIGDGKLNRLIGAFLKAGVLSDAQFLRSNSGTPQGGILSPLLANVALSLIDERYERHVWPRGGTSGSSRGRPVKVLTEPAAIARRAFTNRASDKRRGLPVFVPIRYADDFIILVASPDRSVDQGRLVAEQEKAVLGEWLTARLGLTLSPEKTLVTPVTSSLRFLGHHLRVRRHPTHRRLVPRLVIPKDRSQRLRRTIERIFDRSTVTETLADRLRVLNPVLRGWGYFYRHAWGAKRVFAAIDHYVWGTILRWLRKRHPRIRMRDLAKRYGWHKPRQRALKWRDGGLIPLPLAAIRVVRYQHGSDPGPDFA
jgi:hypothetical protein